METEKTGLEQELNRAGAAATGKVDEETSKAARAMAAEGIVLLKNDNHALPIRNDDTVAVFGRVAVDYFVVGYGSGGDVIAPYKSSLMDGLHEAGVKLCNWLDAQYDGWCHEECNIPDEGGWGTYPMSYAEMPLEEDTVKKAAADSSMALVVIGRAAGEARENLLEEGSFYLTELEKNMLDLVTRHFTRVCVVMDCGNVIDMSWVKDYGDKIQALVYAWQGGMESGYALADILTGKVSPSGKLTDTIAITYGDYPGSANFGGNDYNEYVEDIYVGYRYFETFAPDKVLFPFGFGLSYTEFEVEYDGNASENTITLTANVKNIGTVAGKEIVQLYAAFPCGKLGCPRKVLIGFAKTDTLSPGSSQTLTITADLADFAVYDDSGATGNKSCYVLEEGTYTIEAGNCVRGTVPVLTLKKDTLEVVKVLREAMAVRAENVFDRMVNKDGKLVYEAVPTETKDLKAQILEELPASFAMGDADVTSAKSDADVALTAKSDVDVTLTAKPDANVTFADVCAGKVSVEEFVSQLSNEELDALTHGEGRMDFAGGVSGNAGAFGGVTDSLAARGLPAMITTDGPSGVRIRHTASLLPCGTALASSFNPEGVEHLYSLISRELTQHNVDMLLAPGMNIHRNPLCGRNFEYYSEDPLLTGKIAAAAVRGIQAEGASACPKHFACNNQEHNRNRHDSRVSERALREIYLKGFEIVVKESAPKSIMTSYNKVNGVWSHYNYELVTQILRGEWNYDGLVITDWWMQEGASREFTNITNDAYRIRAQVDVLMPGEIGRDNDPKAHTLVASLRDPQGVTRAEAERSAANVVRFILKSKKIG